MTQTEALKLALDALENHTAIKHPQQIHYRDKAINAIKEALAQKCVCGEPNSSGTHRTDGPCLAPKPEQEPVAWMDIDEKGAASGLRYWHEPENRHEVPLYTTPPQRKPLTDEMTKQMRESCDSHEMRGAFVDGWLSAEAAHGIKE